MIKNRLQSGIDFDISISQQKKYLKVGVLAGGISSEREISLLTGKGIHESLLRSGYEAMFIDMGKDFIDSIINIDAAFIALHGKYGEDGTVQGLLELLKIPYTGSGVLSSALAMDKVLSKEIFLSNGIDTAPFLYFKKGHEANEKIIEKIEDDLKYPLVVKPNDEGSSIGVFIVEDKKALSYGVEEVFKVSDILLAEKFIKGRLITVSIVGKDPKPLPVIEIKPKSGFYDYKSKYTKGLTDYIVPAEIDIGLAEKIKNTAVLAHELLRCQGLSRVDSILGEDGINYILEVNTIPGMTETSLVPKAAAAVGIGFDRLVEIILDSKSLKISSKG